MAATLPTADEVRAIVREELRELTAALDKLRAERAETLVTLDDAARSLGVSRRTVEREIRAGRLASVRLGGARRIRRGDLESLTR